jgi:proline racemase/trans-L-3-hydroxyproline dehydratase
MHSVDHPYDVPHDESHLAVAPVTACDYHTAGEPFRIVTGGAPEIPGDTILDRREAAGQTESIDVMRRLLCHEPRGHADMYGCFVVPPNDAGADFGVLFWHKDGYSTACGHGTIALGAWAVESGLVRAEPDGQTTVTIDVPSGRVAAHVRLRDGVTESVTFESVPAYVAAENLAIGSATVDVAYSGALYASVPAASLGLTVEPLCLPQLIAAGREIKSALSSSSAAQHPGDERLSGIYGTIIHESLSPLHQRNVTIFADGEVDRSPCGSGTSARCALLYAQGHLREGDELVHESIVGTKFLARVRPGSTVEAVLTEVEGMAYKTGEHRFLLDPRDPLRTGFVLR